LELFAWFTQTCEILGASRFENFFKEKGKDEAHVDHDEKDQMRRLELI